MKFLNLSNKSVRIPVVGLGTMGFGGYFSKDDSRDRHVVRLIRAGIDLGMTFIDTAEAYGSGYSEELVGKAIAKKRSKVFVASKFSPDHSLAKQVERACEDSLKRLRTDYIDLYQIHWPNYDVRLEETLSALEALVKKGKVRFIGVCNFPISWVMQVTENFASMPFLSIQDEFNLFERGAEKWLMPFCRQNELIFIAYSPLDQGKLSGYNNYRLLEKIAKKYQKSAAQIILRWIVNHDGVIVIPKSSSLEHLRENAACTDFRIEKSDFIKIENIFRREVVMVSVDTIAVEPESGRKIYLSKKEALANEYGLTPSPKSMAIYLQSHTEEGIKPLKIRAVQRQKFILEEGRMRYWAWVIAFGENSKIPCLIREQ